MKTNQTVMRGAAAMLTALTIAIGSAGCAATRTQESTGEYVDDAAITASVKAALLKESNVKSTDINVETYRGTVQLSGFVDDQTQIDKAVQVARTRNGVKSVKNDLRVKNAPMSGMR